MHPKRVLHPTDYTESSRPSLLEAIAIANENNARLTLLHVVESLGPDRLSYGESARADQPEALRGRLFEELRHILPADAHVGVDYVLSEEDLVTAILRTQAKFHCDLIVLGTHGRTGMRRWLTGSVAEEVIRRAPCPVLVVKGPRPPADLPEYPATKLHPGQLVQSDD
ncbi:MAG TPA: universal stress protein [Gemmataceae bacterium]|jgi:universal stress protein A|nr:universal stress protein [Gemmataceae bacterium]